MTYTLNPKAFTNTISDRALQQLCRETSALKYQTDANRKLIIRSSRMKVLRVQGIHWFDFASK